MSSGDNNFYETNLSLVRRPPPRRPPPPPPILCVLIDIPQVERELSAFCDSQRDISRRALI